MTHPTHSQLINAIQKAWGWQDFQAMEVITTNAFGNVIFKDSQGQFWRLMPEELECEMLAQDSVQYDALLQGEEFHLDWSMEALVQAAFQSVGSLDDGQCYCLKVPGTLGGDYAPPNLGKISILEAISNSGNLALQIKDLPDGAKIVIQSA